MYNSKYHQRALIAKHSLNQLKLRNQRASLMSVPCTYCFRSALEFTKNSIYVHILQL